MDNFNHDELINGANPAFIWGQLMDYFARTAKYMRHIYKDKNQTNTPITWADLDTLNERIRNDLDVIYAGTTNVSDDAPNKNENKTRNNMKRTIRLTESDLHRVIKESVQTILKESNITPNLEQEMERYRDNPNRFMHTLNAYGMRYESILKDAEKMGLDDIAEIAKQRLHQISDEMIKAREQWNFHA